MGIQVRLNTLTTLPLTELNSPKINTKKTLKFFKPWYMILINGLKYYLEVPGPQDHEAIAHLVQICLVEFGQAFDESGSDADVMDIQKTYLSPGGLFFVLRNEQRVLVGTIGLLSIGGGVGKLRKMYVHPAYRSKKIGRFLLQQILEKGRELNFLEVRLETISTMKAAIHLYTQFGFQPLLVKPQSRRCDRVMHMFL
jgi:putative acetyltransferase